MKNRIKDDDKMLLYTSALKPEYIEDLERLMFFNPDQQSAISAIVGSIKKFGTPSVYNDNGCLRVKVEKLEEVQSLFALDDDSLVGVLVYSRVSFECLAVIHIVVDQDYSSHGKFAQNMLVMRMLELLRNNANRVKGVETIRMMYGDKQIRDFSV